MDHAITLGRLRDEACTTKNLRIHGYIESVKTEDEDPLLVYGADAEVIRALAKEVTHHLCQIRSDVPA